MQTPFTRPGVLVLIASMFSMPFSPPAYCQDEADELTAAQRLIEEENGSKALGQVYNRTLLSLADEELWRLSCDANVGIALQAYAQLHNEWRPVDAPWGESPVRLVQADVNRFVGFLEARTRVRPPKWWVTSFKEPYLTTEMEYHELDLWKQLDVAYLLAPEGTHVALEGANLVLSVGEAHAEFGDTVVDLVAAFDEAFIDRCYGTVLADGAAIAFQSDTGEGLLLYAERGEIRWQARLWGQGCPTIFGGGGYWNNDAELIITKECVALFGSGAGGPYIEVFDRAAGKPTLRFGREFWFQRTSRSSRDPR